MLLAVSCRNYLFTDQNYFLAYMNLLTARSVDYFEFLERIIDVEFFKCIF